MWTIKRFLMLLPVAAAAGLSFVARAAYFEASVPPAPPDQYSSAEYRLWMPDEARTLCGLIVKQHGCGRAGLNHANDLQWQALAKKWDCGLLGTWLRPASSNCADWFQPDHGSGRAFLKALETLARQSGRPEVEHVPWALWGHSGGAHWVVAMAGKFPHRVAAVFAQSGGLAPTNYGAIDVPMVFNRGWQDFTNIIKAVSASFDANRPRGALWSLSIDPKARHEANRSRPLAIGFLDAVLAQRLPLRCGSSDLRPPDLTHAWLGDLLTYELSPLAGFKGDTNLTAWLPNETFARRWEEFQRTGAIVDRTPPAAPTDLAASLEPGQVTLRWSAALDLESGLKTFRIYRDGARLADWSGPTNNAAQGFFQLGNYGDEAEPELPEMKFIDLSPPAGTRSYHVTAINWADLESSRSGVVKVVVK